MFKSKMNHPKLGELEIEVTGEKLRQVKVADIGRGYISYNQIRFYKNEVGGESDYDRFCQFANLDPTKDWELQLTVEFLESLREFENQCRADFEAALRAGDLKVIVTSHIGTNAATDVKTDGRFGGMGDFELWYGLASSTDYKFDAYTPDWQIHETDEDVTEWAITMIDARRAARAEEERKAIERQQAKQAEIDAALSLVDSVLVGAIKQVNADGDTCCEIKVTCKDGSIHIFHTRNIFDFGMVLNPEGGGLRNGDYWQDFDADKGGWHNVRPITEQENYAYQAAWKSIPAEMGGIRM